MMWAVFIFLSKLLKFGPNGFFGAGMQLSEK